MATAARPLSTVILCIAGALSLAVAMGVGRFAFTPMLPLMIREGLLDVASGGWIAAANYVGYLVGALTAARLRLRATQLALLGLLATALLTATMSFPQPWLWAVWRLLAGVASAWVFVATGVWCLGALAQAGRSQFGGVVYAGVGIGIAVAGLHVWLAAALGVGAQDLWLQLAVLALALGVPVLFALRRIDVPAPSRATVTSAAPDVSSGLVLSYGVMGFGYILPATFLPVLARNVIDDPRWFGLAWPVFGAMAALSTLLAARWMQRRSRLEVWAVCQALMGAGALLPSLWMHGIAIALSAALVGGTFMVITLAGVQEARVRATQDSTRAIGRMTAAFAAGQIAGPVASALLLHVPALRTSGIDIALQAAALALFATAWWLQREARQRAASFPEVCHAR
uniref:Transporter n=1 Tax=uncultured bacterium 51 TaxID=1748279 RepID=A0A0U3TYB0_9BACT|nr:transporter [uncultured bacterium 51]